MIKIIKVTGSSLSPFFLSGDYVVLNTSSKINKNLHSGDIVVFNHPEYGRLIKRVIANHRGTGKLEVAGDNDQSVSTINLGHIPYSDLIGKVIYHIKQTRSS